jgi:hypothetical protein
MATTLYALAHQVTESVLFSQRYHEDPFNELTVDVIVLGPQGSTWTIPAYWAGGNEWRYRMGFGLPGIYTIRSRCSDPSDPGLHNVEFKLEVVPSNDRLSSRALYVSVNGKYLQFEDGTHLPETVLKKGSTLCSLLQDFFRI